MIKKTLLLTLPMLLLAGCSGKVASGPSLDKDAVAYFETEVENEIQMSNTDALEAEIISLNENYEDLSMQLQAIAADITVEDYYSGGNIPFDEASFYLSDRTPLSVSALPDEIKEKYVKESYGDVSFLTAPDGTNYLAIIKTYEDICADEPYTLVEMVGIKEDNLAEFNELEEEMLEIKDDILTLESVIEKMENADPLNITPATYVSAEESSSYSEISLTLNEDRTGTFVCRKEDTVLEEYQITWDDENVVYLAEDAGNYKSGDKLGSMLSNSESIGFEAYTPGGLSIMTEMEKR